MAKHDHEKLKAAINKASDCGIVTMNQLVTFLDIADAKRYVTYTELAGTEDSKAPEVKRVSSALRKLGPGHRRGAKGYAEGLDLVDIVSGAIPPSGARGFKAQTGVRLSDRGKQLATELKKLTDK